MPVVPVAPAVGTDSGPDVGKLAAGGLTLLSALLTTLSITSGALQAMLQEEPRQSLLVLCLFLSAAFVGAVSVALPKSETRVLWALIPAIAGGVVFLLVLSDLPAKESDKFTQTEANVLVALVLLVGVVMLIKFWTATLALSLLVVLLATYALGLGAYGAVKTVILVQGQPLAPRVSLSISGVGAERKATVSIKSQRLTGGRSLSVGMQVSPISGEPRQSAVELEPNDEGVIEESLYLPLSSADVESIEVCLAVREARDDGSSTFTSGAVDESYTCKKLPVRLTVNVHDTTTTSTSAPPTAPPTEATHAPSTPLIVSG